MRATSSGWWAMWVAVVSGACSEEAPVRPPPPPPCEKNCSPVLNGVSGAGAGGRGEVPDGGGAGAASTDAGEGPLEGVVRAYSEFDLSRTEPLANVVTVNWFFDGDRSEPEQTSSTGEFSLADAPRRSGVWMTVAPLQPTHDFVATRESVDTSGGAVELGVMRRSYFDDLLLAAGASAVVEPGLGHIFASVVDGAGLPLEGLEVLDDLGGFVLFDAGTPFVVGQSRTQNRGRFAIVNATAATPRSGVLVDVRLKYEGETRSVGLPYERDTVSVARVVW